MGDSARGFVVSVEEDLSEECERRLREAIALMRGVVGIDAVYAHPSSVIADARAKNEYYRKIMEVLTDG